MNDKLTALSEFLQSNDFAYVSSLWNSLSEKEKKEFKTVVVSSWSDETILSVYNSFCYINKSLANEMMGSLCSKNFKKESVKYNINPEKETNKNEGKSAEPWEQYIDFKVKYLQAFKAKLDAGGFNSDLASLLTAQELAHLNDLSLGGKGNEQK